MYELLKIYQRGDLQKRIHPVIADVTELNNFGTTYINYWKGVIEAQGKQLKEHNPTTVMPLTARKKICEDISREICQLMSFAGDMVVTPLAILEEQDFAPLLDSISPIVPQDNGVLDRPTLRDDQLYIQDH